MSINSYFQWILLCFSVYLYISGAESTLIGVLNPGCNATDTTLNCNKEPYLYTVKNVPKDDSTNTYFHLWSGTGSPSFATLSLGKGAELSVNWTSLLANEPGAITPSEQPKDAFGVAFTQLVMYNDYGDHGNLAHSNVRATIDMKRFAWRVSDVKDDNTVSVTFTSTHLDADTLPKGSAINITLRNTAAVARGSEAPSLLQSPSSFLVVVELDNLLPINLGKYTNITDIKTLRFGVRMAITSGELRTNTSNLHFEQIKSLDDEYCPGVFKLDSIISPQGLSAKAGGGFMQYRNVVYLRADKRRVTESTLATLQEPGLYINTSRDVTAEEKFSLVNTNNARVEKSLLYSIFGKELSSKIITEDTVVSFGYPGEKYYYIHYSYSLFAFTLGTGKAPTETFSTWMVATIVIGLALPAIFLILGVVGYVIITRRQQRKMRDTDGLLRDDE